MIRELARRYTLARSFVLGAAAYLSGYLVAFLWLGNRMEPIAGEMMVRIRFSSTFVAESIFAGIIEELGGVTATTWAGWLFHNAHFVPLELGISGRMNRGSVPNILLAGDDQLMVLLFLVPVVLLVVAGWLSARLSAPSFGGVFPASTGPGTQVTVGYLPMTIAGVLLFSVSRPWKYSGIAPDLLMSVLIMGFLYPIVFGGIGSWLATKTPASTGANEPDEAEYFP